MATAAAIASPDKTLAERRKLAEELVNIYRNHREDFDRADEIKEALRKIATDAEENFKESFPGKGVTKVSAGHEGKFQGSFPTINERVYFGLPEKKRAQLAQIGLIEMKPKFGGPYYGSVTVDLF